MMKQTYFKESTVTDDNGKIDSVSTSSMESETDGKKMPSFSYPYKAEDGTRTKATFDNNRKSKTITV